MKQFAHVYTNDQNMKFKSGGKKDIRKKNFGVAIWRRTKMKKIKVEIFHIFRWKNTWLIGNLKQQIMGPGGEKK